MYGELVTEFAGRSVFNFNEEGDWEGPSVAYRLREDYEDEVSMTERIDALLAQPDCNRLEALIIGSWGGIWEGEGVQQLVAELAAKANRLPNLRALFIGEMTYEECELSWINQADLAPLLTAFPNLEVLRVRGGNGLAFSRTKHEFLRELAIETGGLPRSVLRDIFLCDFPRLEHLELLLGEENYGFDGGVEDLQPLLSGKLFPELKFLGLMNSNIADEVAAVVVNSPVVQRIEELDLSMGNLTDAGIRSLTQLPQGGQLRRLNVSHHYASPASIAALKQAVACEVVADDPQEADDEWRPILHAE
jgi:hypothetical protein